MVNSTSQSIQNSITARVENFLTLVGIINLQTHGQIDDTYIIKQRMMNVNTQEKIKQLEKKIKVIEAELKLGSNKNQKVLLKIYTEKLEQLKK